MRTLIILAVVLFSSPLYASEHDGSFAVYGVGGNSCVQMVNHLTGLDTWRSDYLNWVSGYVTAAGMYMEKGLKRLSDPDAIFAELVKYCGSNPLSDVQDGAHYIVRNLTGRTKRN